MATRIEKFIGGPSDLVVEQSVKDMIDQNSNKYLLINLLSHRARELNGGSRALVDVPPPHTPLEVAIAEARADKLKYVRNDEEPEADKEPTPEEK